MTETRTPTAQRQNQSSATDEEIAAVIFALLAGNIAVANVAAALAWLLGRLPNAPGAPVLDDVARLVSRDVSSLTDVTGARRAAIEDNLSRRAHYAIRAAERIGRKVSEGEPLADALKGEALHLAKHLERSVRNVEAARATDAMAALHGGVLSWNHGATHEPTDPRPAHLAADGANFDTSQGVPVATGALPGVEPGCTCAWSPPNPNGRTIR